MMKTEIKVDQNRVVGIGPLLGWTVKDLYSEAKSCREQLKKADAEERLELIAEVQSLAFRCDDESVSAVLNGIAHEMTERSRMMAFSLK